MPNPNEQAQAERIAVLEALVSDNRAEFERSRRRLHELESDRATLKLVVEQVRKLTTEMPEIVEQAAHRAVELALNARDDVSRERLGVRIQLLAAGSGFGGFVASVLYIFLR